MIEMAADKEAFRVPAPPPPLPKPPPKGPATCGAGDLPARAAGRGGDGAGKGQGGRGGGDGGLSAPVSATPDPQRGVEASGEEGDSLAELHRPRNGFQAPQPPPPPQQQRPNKRRNSCNVGGGGFKHPAFKRRRRVNSECDPVLPSEFLLGGNIFDPLNLNSLLDEEVNRALNAETPKSSPLPAKGRDPVEILIPKDITDPLSLNNAQEDPPVLASPAKRKRHRHRGGAQRGGSTEGGAPKAPATPAACQSCQKPKPCNGATPQPYELNTVINCRDEVVSPLLPAGHGEPQQSHQQVSGGGVTPSCASVASSASAGSRHHRKRRRTCSKSEGAAARHQGPPFASAEQPSRSSPERARSAPRSRHAPPASARRQSRHKFQYGNYCKYYGYRNPDCEDARLRVMKPEWFQGKEVLDVGCNVGHFTLSVAKKWGPARMVGLDIDGHLIHSARQNIRHYLSEELHQQKQQQQSDESPISAAARKTFPASLMASRGPIAAPRVPQEGTDASVFPNNVIFIKGNYVLERDELLEAQRPEYDVILCLSLTKWVHLNWGDEGLKRLFKRIYRHLRPGGILILEPQAWSSYKKRKNLTETISRHFYRIKLKPDQFPSYLTSSEVGFCSYELVAMPRNTPKGFQRPIYLFHKTRPGGH